MMCCFIAILMMYGSGRSGCHCGLIMMIRYGLCHLYKVCCSTIVSSIIVSWGLELHYTLDYCRSLNSSFLRPHSWEQNDGPASSSEGMTSLSISLIMCLISLRSM